MLEGHRVFADLRVDENLRAASWALTGRRAHPRGGREAVYRFFPLLEARRRHRAGYLPGGEQQMLAIGRAQLTDPAVMLLDEPCLGLAPLLREEIFADIARINPERGVSMLLVEQNAVMALAVARYATSWNRGAWFWRALPRRSRRCPRCGRRIWPKGGDPYNEDHRRTWFRLKRITVARQRACRGREKPKPSRLEP